MSQKHKHLSLSLVIPAYNEAGYVKACLDSVAAQTEMPDEVIVVDNNSTDATARIASRYPFVTLICEKRQGLRFSRNTGLDAARGDILGRIDADTQLGPDWVATARRSFERLGTQAMTGPCYYHDMPFTGVSHKLDTLFRGLIYRESEPVLYGSNMLVSREVWYSIRDEVCMDGEFFEDCDMTIHLQEQGYAVTYDKSLVVGVSARRLDDSPVTFYRNMSQFDETFARHGLEWSGAAAAKRIYYTSYLTCKGIRYFYDSEKQSLSLARLLRPVGSRPNANT